MSSGRLDPLRVPSTSTFSFKAPYPGLTATSSSSSPLKQRRVSLALPSAPRIVQPWNFRDDTGLDSHVPETEAAHQLMPEKRGKMRKIALADGEDADPATGEKEKRQRKKWSAEETQMLVDGCNRHGVGNWKTILGDPNLIFDNRSPVDLKDRFRTYFPDAYKQHYPNARTHLSSKVRSTLPDGTPLFEKTRSKRRRPFTVEEDRALKAGYEKHGTVWAAIVKDPVFQDQARRSTDLRDRFRNAFPELYQAAGYKPRNAASSGAKAKTKKSLGKQMGRGLGMGVRAATDDQLSMSSTGMGIGVAGPVRSRRRAHTTGLLRGGTKSVPQSTACSEDEDSDSGADELDLEEDLERPSKSPPTPVLVDNVSTLSSGADNMITGKRHGTGGDQFTDEMEMVTLEQLASDPLGMPVFLPSGNHNTNDVQTWSSSVDTPTHSHNAWSTAAGSPTSSHPSTDYEYLLTSGTQSHSHSPSFTHTHATNAGNTDNMIGKSAWGTQDWLFSSNPRIDHTSPSHSSSSYLSPGVEAHSHGLSLSPPHFSLAFPLAHHALTSNHTHPNLSSHTHGVLDRYDLFPSSFSLSHHGHLHDFASDIGAGGGGGDGFSDADAEFPPSGFRGFTHHSSYAGDLIFGARGLGSGIGLNPGPGYYGSGPSTSGAGGFNYGLGLSGMGGGGSEVDLHSMQVELPGIDEIEIAGITLEDQQLRGQGKSHQQSDDDRDADIESCRKAVIDTSRDGDLRLDSNVKLGNTHSITPRQQSDEKDDPSPSTLVLSHSHSPLIADLHHKFDLDLVDLVDLSGPQHPDDGSELDLDLELHTTPPDTPMLNSLSGFSDAHAGFSALSRARSARRSSASTEFHHYHNYQHNNDSGSGLHHHGRSISVPPLEARAHTSAGVDTGLGSRSKLGRGQEQRSGSKNSVVEGSSDAGRNLSSATVAVQPQPHKAHPMRLPSQMTMSSFPQDAWRSLSCAPAADINLSFLDLHYYGGNGSTVGVGGQDVMTETDPLSRHGAWERGGRQGQALDLAASPSSISSTAISRTLVMPTSFRQHMAASAGTSSGAVGNLTGTGVRNSGGLHQRVQSAVCPKDLVLTSGDNKRKRASWDGAHVF